jgi:hypothetical protein
MHLTGVNWMLSDSWHHLTSSPSAAFEKQAQSSRGMTHEGEGMSCASSSSVDGEVLHGVSRSCWCQRLPEMCSGKPFVVQPEVAGLEVPLADIISGFKGQQGRDAGTCALTQVMFVDLKSECLQAGRHDQGMGPRQPMDFRPAGVASAYSVSAMFLYGKAGC